MEMKLIEKTNILGKILKVYGDKENPLFLAKDIAEWIDHTDVSMMCKNLEFEIEKLVQTILVSGQNREVTFLTEYGVYEVLMTSRKKIAKEFRKGFKNFLRDWRLGKIKVTETSNNNLLQVAQNLLNVCTEHENRINTLEDKIENSIVLETYQRGIVQKAINRRVYARYEELRESIEKRELYSNIHRDIKYKFNVRSYGDIRKKDYEIALNWIETWVENSNLRG
ncbi:MAG: BRO family protein [Cetobacterium sp.]|uniref:BRO family protein n=1 Tax=Cetobacterium sp. TaxID=2071632 RepID=UPI003F386950